MYYKKLVLSLAMMLCVVITLPAQEIDDSGKMNFDHFFSMVLTYLGEDGDDEVADVEELHDRLWEAYHSPIEWNRATKNSLDELLFLPDELVENMLYYADVYGPVHSIAELLMVPDIEQPMLLILSQIIVVEQKQDSAVWSDAFRYTRHNVMSRIDATIEPTGKDKQYDGVPFRTMLRYTMSARNNFRANVVMETDAKEPWTKGFDMYRFFAQADNVPRLGRIVVGSYKIGFGKGLVFGSMGYGSRVSRVLNDASSYRAPSGYSGVSEAPSLFGVATSSSADIGHRMSVDISALYSYSPLDADTTGGVWSSVATSGYHRTNSEQRKMNTLSLHTIGADVSVVGYRFNVGVTMCGGFFSLPALPADRYADIDFRGDKQLAVSAHYAVKYRKVNFSGEVAVGGNGAAATVNSLHIVPSSSYNIAVNHRYISPRYHSFWANAPLATSSNGEHGASVALQLPITRSSSLSLLGDVFLPLRLTTATSNVNIGYEVAVEEKSLLKRVNIYSRLRYKEHPSWETLKGATTSRTRIERIGLASFSADYSVSNEVRMKSVAQANVSFSSVSSLKSNNIYRPTWGANIYQDVSYSPHAVKLDLIGRLAFCYAPDWSNRFYAYEREVSSSGYSPAMYGVSLRWYVMARYSFNFGLDISARLSQSVYFDREIISSGISEIQGNHKTDIHVYVSYRI